MIASLVVEEQVKPCYQCLAVESQSQISLWRFLLFCTENDRKFTTQRGGF